MAVLHRLVLFLIWAVTLFLEFVFYRNSEGSLEYRGESTSFFSVIAHDYQTMAMTIAVSLGLSLCVNWIFTGNMHNWAGKIWNN